MPSGPWVIEPLERRTLMTVPGGGFDESVVGQGLNRPTALAIGQNVRNPAVFVIEQGGRLRRFQAGSGTTRFLGQLERVATGGDLGLVGIALDRSFPRSPVVYLNYTAPGPEPHQRISKFFVNDDELILSSEQVLLDLPSWEGATTNVGGGMQVGFDGTLLVGVGDGGKKERAQDPNSPFGKVLRIRPDGSAPADNPFAAESGGSGWGRYVWARGLRNPVDLSVHPSNGVVYVNDQGDKKFEEVNFGAARANYGWPEAEGGEPTDPAADVQGPAYSYAHLPTDDPEGRGVGRIAGGLWFVPGTLTFPVPFGGDYFFADQDRNAVFALDVDTKLRPNGEVVEFAIDVPAPVDLAYTAEGLLFVLARGGGDGDGKLIRYKATGGPFILRQPQPATVAVGGTVRLSVAASGRDALSYQWQRDGADIAGATRDTYAYTPGAVEESGTTFTVRVRNDFGTTISRPAVVTVTPPVAGGDPGGGGTDPGDGGGGGEPGGGTGGGGGGGGGYSPFLPTKPPPPPMGPIDLLPVVGGRLPAAVIGGGRGKATVKVFNLGLDTARGPLTLRLRFSADDASGPGDLLAAEATANIRIKPGSAKSFKLAFAYPEALDGAYRLLAEVDPTDALPETNEENNVAASALPVQVRAPFVDVRTRLGPSAAAALPAGGRTVVPVSVYNDGNVAAAGEMTVLVWAVPPGTAANEAPAVGTLLFAGPVKLKLAPTRGKTVKLKLELPTALPAGVYELVATVDAGAAVGETDPANNASAGPSAVTVG